MTQEQKQIAILAGMGWEPTSANQGKWAPLFVRNSGEGVRMLSDFPDYLNDRNAIHKAINTLSYSKQVLFLFALNEMGIVGEWDILTASPEDLAEAFLRTIGKWVES